MCGAFIEDNIIVVEISDLAVGQEGVALVIGKALKEADVGDAAEEFCALGGEAGTEGSWHADSLLKIRRLYRTHLARIF